MSKPVTESAFVERLARAAGCRRPTQSRTAHGAKTSERDRRRHDDDQPDPRAPVEARDAPGDDDPGEAEPDGLVAGQRGQPDEHARAR